MKSKPLLLALVAVMLLVSLAAQAEAGVSFHPRPKEKNNSRGSNTRTPSTKREVYDDVMLQMEEGRSDSAVAQVEMPSRLGLRMSEAQEKQYGELLVWMLNDLLSSDGILQRQVIVQQLYLKITSFRRLSPSSGREN